MTPLTRITFDPEVMGGKPCIRGLRITVGTIVAGERSKLKRVAIATLERGQLEATLQSLGVDPKQLSS